MKIQAKKFRVSTEAIGWFLMILFHYEPQYFTKIGMLHSIFNIGQAATYLVIPAVVWCHRGKYKVGPMLTVMTLAEIWLVVTSLLLNSNDIVRVITHAVSAFFFVFMLDYMICKNAKRFIMVTLTLYEMLIYGCLITMILFPRGLYGNLNATRKYWLLGQVNSNIIYILHGLMLSFLYSFCICEKKKHALAFRTIILLAVSLFMVVRAWSANAIAGLFVASIVLFVNLFKVRLKLFWGCIASIGAWIGFGFLRLQTLFAAIINNILHRDLSFSGRVRIWDSAMKYIAEKPFTGYGLESSTNSMLKFGGVTQAHNKYFQLIYQGGIVLLLLFMLLSFSTARCLDKRRNTQANAVLTACLFSFMIVIIFESYTSVLFFFPFIVAFHIEEIENIDGGRLNKVLIWKKKK